MHAQRDVGLGTAFERWAIYDLLGRWFARRPPATALEGPVDGMAGMGGLHLLPLARRGTDVTVVLPDAAAREAVETVYRRAGLRERLTLCEVLPDASADLVLAFNIAPHVGDWRAVVGELARRSRRHVLLFSTHPGSYGVGIRRVLRQLEPGAHRPELFDHEGAQPDAVRACLARHGELTAEAFVDCPWWPDLFVNAGETLLGASAARVTGRSVRAAETPWDATPETFPFAAADVPRDLRFALRRHPHFDGRASLVARWFAHHRAYLLHRGNVDLPQAAE